MSEAASRSALIRVLDGVERIGNRLPDPALLFVWLLLAVWICSAIAAQFSYSLVDPRTSAPIEVNNLLTGASLTAFFAGMVDTFVNFHPLGVVLVAMLGIGVADHTGFISAGLRALLGVTSPRIPTRASASGRAGWQSWKRTSVATYQ